MTSEISAESSDENSFFREKDETLGIIIDLIKTEASELNAEKLISRLRKILDSYQEQPQLLGPCCEELLTPVRNQLAFLVSSDDTANAVRLCFIDHHIISAYFLVVVIKVRQVEFNCIPFLQSSWVQVDWERTSSRSFSI